MSPKSDSPKRDDSDKFGSIEGLLASREILVTCGPGGVGKTTTAAAAAAAAAARLGGKVLVITIDPAKRLADALGLTGIGNDAVTVSRKAFTDIGIRPLGELSVAMLDTKQSWDDLVRRHAPDKDTRDRILANPLYHDISARFVQSHDYIAMERLFEIHSEGTYDLIVVDTPPSRNALDFLDAPERMADFFSSRLLRWLIAPYRSRLVNFASKPFYQVADRVLGTQFLGDISEFFILFQSMYDGFVERSRAVQRLMADNRTSFIIVSTLEAAPLREAEFFAKELEARGLHLGAIVLNKVLPDYLRDPAGAKVAEKFRSESEQLATELCSKVPDIEGDGATLTSRVLAEVGQSYLDFRSVARRETEQLDEMARLSEELISIPFFHDDIVDLSGLLRLGAKMWPDGTDLAAVETLSPGGGAPGADPAERS